MQLDSTPIEYPDGIDAAWLAADSQGKVAAFTTAGCGPIPLSAMRSLGDEKGVCDWHINRLPRRGASENLGDVSNSSSFVEMADRGFYVFDFAAFGEVEEFLGTYVLVARPSAPILLSQLPSALNTFCAATAFERANLAKAISMDPLEFFECVESPRG